MNTPHSSLTKTNPTPFLLLLSIITTIFLPTPTSLQRVFTVFNAGNAPFNAPLYSTEQSQHSANLAQNYYLPQNYQPSSNYHTWNNSGQATVNTSGAGAIAFGSNLANANRNFASGGVIPGQTRSVSSVQNNGGVGGGHIRLNSALPLINLNKSGSGPKIIGLASPGQGISSSQLIRNQMSGGPQVIQQQQLQQQQVSNIQALGTGQSGFVLQSQNPAQTQLTLQTQQNPTAQSVINNNAALSFQPQQQQLQTQFIQQQLAQQSTQPQQLQLTQNLQLSQLNQQQQPTQQLQQSINSTPSFDTQKAMTVLNSNPGKVVFSSSNNSQTQIPGPGTLPTSQQVASQNQLTSANQQSVLK